METMGPILSFTSVIFRRRSNRREEGGAAAGPHPTQNKRPGAPFKRDGPSEGFGVLTMRHEDVINPVGVGGTREELLGLWVHGPHAMLFLVHSLCKHR